MQATNPSRMVLFFTAATALGCCVTASAVPAHVEFSRDVRPILTANCFACHGPDKQKAGLRLDTAESSFKPLKSGSTAIVPGKSEESEIVRRIVSTDADEHMPPEESHKELTVEQVDVLRKWIADGAKYQGHWAFTAPIRPAVPQVADEKWPRNPIDRFIAARLDAEHLKPSTEADRPAILRRLSLDLIGLPPSPSETDAFVADHRPDAYEHQVDRLLASPHFGEKWARHWLDAARYADSDGYEKDLPRDQHAWRDWVINAFNHDVPYDQFVIQQLAGDLLPVPDDAVAAQDLRIATGFLRNGMVNEEGAIINEQFRVEGLIDRLDCVGKSVLGLTIQCAQCHNHKFDPLTQEEYYKLFACLNNDFESIDRRYTATQLEKIALIHWDIRGLETKLKVDHPDWAQQLSDWEEVQSTHKRASWEWVTAIATEWVDGLAHPEQQPDHSILTLGFRPTDGYLWVTSETKLTNITGLRLEALTHGDLPFGGPGRSANGTFAISEVTIEATPANQKEDKWQKVATAGATADFEQADQPIEEQFRKGADDKRRIGPANYLVDGKDETAWGVDRGPGRRHVDSQAVIRFAKPVGFPDGTRLRITLRFKHGGSDPHGRGNNFLGRFRLAITTEPDPKADVLPKLVRDALAISADDRTAEQRAAIFSYWRTTVPEFTETNTAIDKLWAEYPLGSTMLDLAPRSPQLARRTFLLERGSWQKPGREVTAGTPAFLNPPVTNGPVNRLTLAKWLVDRRSPTAARVAVNRIWQAMFGSGIVLTSEDFGLQGEAPSHPELLDWLAVEFMDRGWSQKQLIREIVMSATYRQDSRATPELLDRDPHNRLLARGPRFRADAEMVRDVVLSTAGLLNDQIGGPSFFPPVPQSLFAQSFLDVDFWKVATGPERYRRSLYVFRRRSMPDPVLGSFDAPSGDAACARRVRSNTPLAALAGLNEPVFVEAARALALRILRDGGTADDQRAMFAFRLCVGREPKASEVETIVSLLKSQHARIADGWLSAREIATGNPAAAPALPPNTSPTDAASWTLVARVLLNLDETLSKN